MRKEDVIDGIIEDIGDLVSEIESKTWDIDRATCHINNKLGNLQEINSLNKLGKEMTMEEIAKMIKLYRRMRLAQREGDNVLVDIILEQIDALVEE